MPCRSKLLPPRAAASVHRGSSALARSVAETSDDMSSTCLSTNDSLGTSGFRFRTWGKVTNRSGPIDSEPAHGASPRCQPIRSQPRPVRHTSTASQPTGRQAPCVRHKACRPPFLAHRLDRSPGENKTHRPNVRQDAAGAQVPDMLCNHHGRQKRGRGSQRFNFGGGT